MGAARPQRQKLVDDREAAKSRAIAQTGAKTSMMTKAHGLPRVDHAHKVPAALPADGNEQGQTEQDAQVLGDYNLHNG